MPMDSIWVVRLDAPGGGPRLAVKDCIDMGGLPTTAGCQAIAEQAVPAERDAPVVAAAITAVTVQRILLGDIEGFAVPAMEVAETAAFLPLIALLNQATLW